MVEDIKTVPIYEALSRFVKLDKKGSNYSACCPLHDEKTPSFVVFPKTNTFKCFGCGKGGDAINFVMELKHVDFIEACKLIAHNHGITVSFSEENKPDPKSVALKNMLFSINFAAQQYFVSKLFAQKNEPVLNYALGRWQLDTIKMWSIGYAPDSWNMLKDHLLSSGFTLSDLKASGLLSESKNSVYDRFRNRLMFPIADSFGKIIGFSGRDLSEVI